MPSIAIIGASPQRSKFGNKAVRAYINQNWQVYPVNPKAAKIEDLTCYASISELPSRPDRIALYVPPSIAVKVIEAAEQRFHGDVPEIWINPGVGSAEVFQSLESMKINYRDACAIVDVGESPASYPG